MGIENLLTDKAYYEAAGRQIILKSHLIDIIDAILSQSPSTALPPLVWVDAATVRIEATTDSSVTIPMSGYPNIYNPTENITGDLTDGGSREIAANVSMNFGVSSNLWGLEKASQWYAVYAIADDNDTDFTLKAMPYFRVDTQAVQTIHFGSNGAPATGVGYTFTTDEFVNSKIYFLSGASKGLIRTITANNNSASDGTVTYSGSALTVAEGDWFIILPATNFRRVGDIFNNSASNLVINGNLFGEPNIIREPVTTATSRTISNLSPGSRYRLTIRTLQNTSNGRYDLNFNADTGANYAEQNVQGLTAVVSADGASARGRIDLSPAGGGNEVKVGEGFSAVIDIFNFFDDPTKVHVHVSSGCYINAGSWATKHIYGYYDGAAALTSLVVSVSAGTMTGELVLEKLK